MGQDTRTNERFNTPRTLSLHSTSKKKSRMICSRNLLCAAGLILVIQGTLAMQQNSDGGNVKKPGMMQALLIQTGTSPGVKGQLDDLAPVLNEMMKINTRRGYITPIDARRKTDTLMAVMQNARNACMLLKEQYGDGYTPKNFQGCFRHVPDKHIIGVMTPKGGDHLRAVVTTDTKDLIRFEPPLSPTSSKDFMKKLETAPKDFIKELKNRKHLL